MTDIKSILLVALGGALGSVARYLLSGLVLQHTLHWRFPLGTFLVNIIGCFTIGVLAGLAVKDDFFSIYTRVFLFTGIIGGFTTFSAFGLETFYLMRRGESLVAASYVTLSIFIGLLVLWFGYSIVSARHLSN